MTFPQKLPYTWAIMAGRIPTKEAPLFGQRLAAVRRERGLSQEAFASALGTTRANVAYYERSAKNPTLDFIRRCAEVLDIPPSELVGPAEANAAGRKRGPKSVLEQRFEEVSKLPRSRQKEIIKVVDALLSQAS